MARKENIRDSTYQKVGTNGIHEQTAGEFRCQVSTPLGETCVGNKRVISFSRTGQHDKEKNKNPTFTGQTCIQPPKELVTSFASYFGTKRGQT